MGTSPVGSVVLVAFPYANFTQFKLRPALVIGVAEFDNLILCQITSKALTSQRAFKLEDSDFLAESLHLVSYARPDKIFTIEKSVIEKHIGQLTPESTNKVLAKVREIFEERRI